MGLDLEKAAADQRAEHRDKLLALRFRVDNPVFLERIQDRRAAALAVAELHHGRDPAGTLALHFKRMLDPQQILSRYQYALLHAVKHREEQIRRPCRRCIQNHLIGLRSASRRVPRERPVRFRGAGIVTLLQSDCKWLALLAM